LVFFARFFYYRKGAMQGRRYVKGGNFGFAVNILDRPHFQFEQVAFLVSEIG
jgi:hypothetical protein